MKIFYTQLNGIRAIAVIAVMLSHWVFISQDRTLVDFALFKFFQNLGMGFIGVNIFFVLSGFLITEILLQQKGKQYNSKKVLKNFYVRRVLRIFPIYYLVVFTVLIFDFDNGRYLFPVNVSYTLNFYNSFTGNIGNGLSHIWSLCVEEQFYIVWPLLLLFIPSKYHKTLIVSIIIAALIYRAASVIINFQYYHIQNYRMMPGCLDALGFGALLAYFKINHLIYLKKILKISVIPIIAFSVYLLAIIAPKNYIAVYEILARFSISVFSFYLIGKAVFNFDNWFGKILENRFIQYLGKISYGLYLYHLIISTALENEFLHFWNNLNGIPSILKYNAYIISAPLFFGLTVLIATLSYYLIERPFLQLKHNFEIKWEPNSIFALSDADELRNDMPSIYKRLEN